MQQGLIIKMNILWISNDILPPIAKFLDEKASPKESWVYSSLSRVSRLDAQSKFAVATTYQGNVFIKKEIEGILYYCLPAKNKIRTKPMPHLREYWKDIQENFKPDIVHIHGSEYFPGYEWCNMNGYENVVLSIQGILSAYSRYYGGDMKGDIKYLTFRDFIKKDSLKGQIRKWDKRGKAEEDFYKKLKFFIGRTEWDRSHVWALNPNARYFYGGETLRSSFYKNRWSYQNCRPHSIFISQGSYPLKGADIVIKAMPLVLRHFPDASIQIAGYDIIHKPWYRIGGYAKYLKRLIKQLNLQEKVTFLGMVDEERMCKAYLDANVFICPSSIENSPNSLGEAQMLGMPHLASFVGGTPEITDMNHDVLYRFEEVEMLAEKICKIFSMESNFQPSDFDKTRYDGDLNARLLFDTYKEIASQK